MSRSDVLGICRPILEFPTTRHFHSISDQQFNGLRIRDKSPRNSGHLGKEKAVPSIKIALKSCGYEITVLHPLCFRMHRRIWQFCAHTCLIVGLLVRRSFGCVIS